MTGAPGRRTARIALALTGAVALLTGCSGPDGLHGRFISVDDTGLPDSPVDDTAVLVIPADAVADLLDGFSTDPSSLQNVAGSVSEAALLDAGGRRYVTDRKGRFALDVEPGTYDVCSSWADPRADPVDVDACAVATLPEDADLVLSVGEAPFAVTVET